MIELVAKILKVLNSENAPWQVALAVCLAMVCGLTPFFSIHNILVLFCVLVLRVNLSSFILFLALFSGAAYLFDPVFHRVGLLVLTQGWLEGLWTWMYNSAFFRLAKFNNTVEIGSLLVSLILFYPLYRIVVAGINRYREKFMGWVRKSRLVQTFRLTKFYRIYKSLDITGGQS